VDFTEFVTSSLPAAPCTVLEVGCGEGELALYLADYGHAVTAIDPEAPPGSIFRGVGLEDFDAPSPFHAVVANRSLHHIHDLDAALGKIRSLLEPDGLLIVNEFAWDRMDEATAAWYLSHDVDKDHNTSLQPDNFPDMWMREHAGLHVSAVLEEGLANHFQKETFEWVPYIARYYLDRDSLEAAEAKAISEGRIRAIGFRYIGRKTDRNTEPH
jgi:SAM-dependent methyltransferase